MRWNEVEAQPPKKEKEEKPRELPKAGQYEMEDLPIKSRPLLGGNSFA